jgi:hypothetical protein
VFGRSAQHDAGGEEGQEGGGLMGTYEYRLTCRHCGTERFAARAVVEAKPLKARSRLSRSLPELIPWTRSAQQFTAANAMIQTANLAATLACSSCGSSSLDKQKVKV